MNVVVDMVLSTFFLFTYIYIYIVISRESGKIVQIATSWGDRSEDVDYPGMV